MAPEVAPPDMRRIDAADALFEAEVAEAKELAGRTCN